MSTDKTLSSKTTRFAFLGMTGAALAVAALLSGCNKKDTVDAGQPSVSSEVKTDVKADAQKAVDETKKVASEAKDAVENAADKVGADAKAAAEKAAADTKAAGEKAAADVKAAADKAAADAKAAAEKAKNAVSSEN